MSQIFYINQNATLPILRMELVRDGKKDFYKSAKFNNAIQNADITFSMWDEHDILKIASVPCDIVLSDEDGCEEQYIIQYKWKKHDTKNKGHFKGRFNINFKDDLYEMGNSYPNGDLIVPIYEELEILIK